MTFAGCVVVSAEWAVLFIGCPMPPEPEPVLYVPLVPIWCGFSTAVWLVASRRQVPRAVARGLLFGWTLYAPLALAHPEPLVACAQHPEPGSARAESPHG